MRITYHLMACLLALAVSAAAAAATTFDKQVDAEARGVVEISNTSGSVEVSGWDKPQVSVHAELGGAVERVEVTSEPGRTLIKVLVPGHSWGDGEAKLHVQVPKGSELHLSTVSANANVSGVLGVQRLTVVSGDVVTEIAGADLELVRRHLEERLARFLRRHDDGVAGAVGRTAREGPHVMRAGIRVGGVDDDGVDRNAQRLGGDLLHHRLQPLAEIDARQGDDEIAGRRRMHEGLRRIAAEIHTRGVVDRGDAAPARLRHGLTPHA